MRREKGCRVFCRALQREISENFSDNAGEFEAVPGEARRDSDLRIFRVSRDDKMAVRRIGIHAGHRTEAAIIERRNARCDISAHLLDFGFPHRALNGVRRAGRAPGMQSDFDTMRWPVHRWKAIKIGAILALPDINWETLWQKRLHAAQRLEPIHHLPLDR